MRKSSKRLCRSGIIAALYISLTYAFAPVAFGGLQVRPAEALCLLPLFFPEAIAALTVGCFISNLPSPYFFYDVTLGSLATLLAATLTYLVGRIIKKEGVKIALGGVFPVLVNAMVLPFVVLFLYGEGSTASLTIAYFTLFGSVALCQIVWVYGLGIPLYFAVKRLRKRGAFLTD